MAKDDSDVPYIVRSNVSNSIQSLDSDKFQEEFMGVVVL